MRRWLCRIWNTESVSWQSRIRGMEKYDCRGGGILFYKGYLLPNAILYRLHKRKRKKENEEDECDVGKFDAVGNLWD